MNQGDLDVISSKAVSKINIAMKYPGKYLASSMIAGFYIIVAIILSYTVGALLFPVNPQAARIGVSVCFAIAIILIVFLGGDLFTGNNLVMSIGAMEKKTTWKNAIYIWIFSYIGNFLGAFLLGFIFVKSGASIPALKEYLEPLTETKLAIPEMQLFLRGILCNFMVCIAILAGNKLKSESGKLIIMAWVIATFVMAGFEHSIANMGIFSIAGFMGCKLDMVLVMKSMLFVTLGNIVGGAFLLGLPIKLMTIKEK